MCLQCAPPRHLIEEPRINLIDIVALRGTLNVPDRTMQNFVPKLRGTRGVVTEVSGPYYAVTFADGSSGEFTQDELIRVGPAVV